MVSLKGRAHSNAIFLRRADDKNQKTFVQACMCGLSCGWPLSLHSFPHDVSFLILLCFSVSNFLQPSSCCSTWSSTVSWPACSPWRCGWCCSLWMTMCRGTETEFPIQVSDSQRTEEGWVKGLSGGNGDFQVPYLAAFLLQPCIIHTRTNEMLP